jgi:hypothetical protein
MAMVERVLVDQPVEFARADPRFDVRTDEVDQLGIEPSGRAQAVSLVRRLVSRDRWLPHCPARENRKLAHVRMLDGAIVIPRDRTRNRVAGTRRSSNRCDRNILSAFGF